MVLTVQIRVDIAKTVNHAPQLQVLVTMDVNMDGSANNAILVNNVKTWIYILINETLNNQIIILLFVFFMLYTLRLLLIVCNDGTYVFDGKCVKCQGVCKDNAPCNKSTGRCDNGCSNHWTGIFCEGTHKLFNITMWNCKLSNKWYSASVLFKNFIVNMSNENFEIIFVRRLFTLFSKQNMDFSKNANISSVYVFQNWM